MGGKYLCGTLSPVGAEVTSGDRGDAATLIAEYRLSPEHSFYGGYTYSTDSTEYDSLFNPNRQNGWTLGQRWRLSNQVNLFNESQYLKSPSETGLAHTFGMDFYPSQGWTTGFTLQSGELTKTRRWVDRRAVSINGADLAGNDWNSSGVAQGHRCGTARAVGQHQSPDPQFNESWRVAASLNYSTPTTT